DECTGPRNNQCINCVSPRLLYRGDCLAKCPAGTWSDISNTRNRVCRGCHANCKTCSGPGAHRCTSCRNNAFWSKSAKSCVSTCQVGTYG
ncbi:hypothetical protein DKP78_19775, partial [Enterococcus faecium]